LNSYSKINSVLGWGVFAIATIVYIVTSEPTTSFWDCGEYIATAYKLQVGHPPGAPLFQMLGRFFSLFAFGNTALVARMINTMSALSSSFTILFLFWSITHLARKIVVRNGEMTQAKIFAVMGSGLVGALAYTFSDSFWFSAVEGEVYAMSSFFTALVFWAILKWEESENEKHAMRWIILIAYLMGLSIGVHLLNLLAIPAITFVYYYKKRPNPSKIGILKALLVSILLLAFVMYGIIPWIVKLAGNFELFFVNTLRFPFNSGTLVYFVLLIGGIIWGLHFTRKRRKVILNTIILCVTFILIGYSSFFLLIIRSNAGTPINENEPKDAIGLLAYLNREQYGDWPLLYGQYYNAPVVEHKNGNPVYTKDREKGKYIIIDKREGVIPVYDPEFMTLFPRMWNNQESRYADGYEQWGEIIGKPVSVKGADGQNTIIEKPTLGENLRYFVKYQINYMYLRYFMWNFAGRQNDNQGFGNLLEGNWISGIKFVDKMRLGPQDNIPDNMRSKARNRFYMLPLLVGLIGLFYHIKANKKDVFVVTLLFIMTGLAIVVYLNQHAPQPRERDYAFAASFYAFTIWIGLGVLSLFEELSKIIKAKTSAIVTTLVCLILVPGIMAKEGWDDHDRSNKYLALHTAKNYLNSCARDAIIFTNGDNDTFPLWYAQEVEGIRTDIRVVNMSLLNTDWYIDQMQRKAYDSDPVPFSINKDLLKSGSLNVLYLIEQENIQGYIELRQLFDLLKKDKEKLEIMTEIGPLYFFPTKNFMVNADSTDVINSGTLPRELANKIVPVEWKLNRNAIYKNAVMALDFLAYNNWQRPVYFATTTGNDVYLNLEKYFQLEGMAYRLVPIETDHMDGYTGRINSDILYNNMMNKFEYGNISDPGVYVDETGRRMVSSFRNHFSRLATTLGDEGKLDSALAVCDRCIEVIPDETIPYNMLLLPIAETYYICDSPEKGNAILNRLLDYYEQELFYYFSFNERKIGQFDFNIQQALALTQHIGSMASHFGDNDLKLRADEILYPNYELYLQIFNPQEG